MRGATYGTIMNTIIHGLDDGSGVVVLPREMLDSLGLVPCDDLERQMRAARDVMDKYEPALQKLAKQIG